MKRMSKLAVGVALSVAMFGPTAHATAPGQNGRITFTADQAGVFEAELEDLGVPIAELTVSP